MMQFGHFRFLSLVIVSFHLLRGVTSDRELLSCSFETSCGLQHTTNSRFYWQSISGATPNPNTGPSNDHTFGNRNGKYIYAPSSEHDYDFGGRSTLYSPEYRLTSGRGRIEFYYHMYDGTRPNDMGSLEVYACGTTVAAWTRRRNQGDSWKYSGQVDFTCQLSFRVYIVAVRGKYQSDIAIDDLTITDVFEDPTTARVTTDPTTTTPTIAPATTQQTTPRTTITSTTTRPTPPKPPSTKSPIIPAKTAPSTSLPTTKVVKDGVLTGAWTNSPQASTVTSASKETPAGSLAVTMTTASSIESVQTSVAPNNALNISGSLDPQLQNGASSPSFVGPIVVVCVAVLFVGLTLCLAVTRKKKSARKPTSHTGKEVKYTVENPSYCEMVDSVSAVNNTKRADYSYQELQQQSYNSIDEMGRESDVEYHTVDTSDTAGAGSSYQEVGEKDAPKRRGESVLYTAIPDQGSVTNEYSYSYANRDGMGGASGRHDGDEQEYAAIRDPIGASNVQGAASSYNMVENQLYVPFKE